MWNSLPQETERPRVEPLDTNLAAALQGFRRVFSLGSNWRGKLHYIACHGSLALSFCMDRFAASSPDGPEPRSPDPERMDPYVNRQEALDKSQAPLLKAHAGHAAKEKPDLRVASVQTFPECVNCRLLRFPSRRNAISRKPQTPLLRAT